MEEIRVYPDPQGFFCVQMPHNWRAEKSEGLVEFLAPEKIDGVRPNFSVMAQHVPPLTMEEYITFTRLEGKQLAQKEFLDRDESLDSNTHVFEWLNQLAPIVTWQRCQLFFGKNQKVFSVTAACLPHLSNKIFDSIFDSFESDESIR